MRVKIFFLTALSFFYLPAIALAATQNFCGESFTEILLSLSLVLLVAKAGGEIALRLKQPAVLGELVGGIVVGNLWFLGVDAHALITSSEFLKALAEVGVVLLLFEVGLESSVKQMRAVGASALFVALLGVLAPFFLGWGLSAAFHPTGHVLMHVFVGATLTATSVGITARVLKDLGRLSSPEARIILGAAVIDDVLGLIILAVVTGLIATAGTGAELSLSAIFLIIGKAFGFLFAAVICGPTLSQAVFTPLKRFKKKGAVVLTGLILCFLFSAAAGLIGLAPIVGAFVAGLVIDTEHYKDPLHPRIMGEEIEPLTMLLVPVFFVSMGAQVDLRAFADPGILGFAFWLTLAAVVGKQICGLGVLERGLDRVLVGLGMIPRGEVGLIFAGIGAGLMLAGERVIDSQVYAAIVVMVVLTTMFTPPLLNWRSRKKAPLSGTV